MCSDKTIAVILLHGRRMLGWQKAVALTDQWCRLKNRTQVCFSEAKPLMHSNVPSHKNKHHHLKVVRGNILEQNLMLSFIPGESRWSTVSSGSGLLHVLLTALAALFWWSYGGDTEIASESSVSRAMKNSPCRPRVSAATGRQLLAWLPAPLLFHYFTFHLEWGLKVSQQALISPRRFLSALATTDSERNKTLLTLWQIPRLPIFIYQCCVFPRLVVSCQQQELNSQQDGMIEAFTVERI